jgi:hypothetical protein
MANSQFVKEQAAARNNRSQAVDGPQHEMEGETIRFNGQVRLPGTGQIRPVEMLSMQQTVGNRAVVQTIPDEEKDIPDVTTHTDADPGYTGYDVEGEHDYAGVEVEGEHGRDAATIPDVTTHTDADPGYTGYDVEGEHDYAGVEVEGEHGRDAATITDPSGGKGKSGYAVIPGAMPEDYPPEEYEEGPPKKEGEVNVPATGGGYLSGLDPSALMDIMHSTPEAPVPMPIDPSQQRPPRAAEERQPAPAPSRPAESEGILATIRRWLGL